MMIPQMMTKRKLPNLTPLPRITLNPYLYPQKSGKKKKSKKKSKEKKRSKKSSKRRSASIYEWMGFKKDQIVLEGGGSCEGAILDFRTENGVMQALVKWNNKALSNSWSNLSKLSPKILFPKRKFRENDGLLLPSDKRSKTTPPRK